MIKTEIQSIVIPCRLEGITILTEASAPSLTDTVILHHNQPYSLKVSVNFVSSNSIALLALMPTLRADFYAIPLGIGQPINLGTACLSSQPLQRTYSLVLQLPSLEKSGFAIEHVYRLNALIRIGATDQPALLCGLLEAPVVQVYGDSS